MGGPERYLFNLKEILESNQHTVIPFSIKYSINELTEYDKYFATPLSDTDSVYFKDQKKSLKNLSKTLERNFYSKEVEINLSRLINDTKPDFALVLLYLRKLSPAVLVALNKNKIPFAVRLSDFGMICPGLNLFRENHTCELCVKGNLWNSVKYKCVHGSHVASFVNYAATKYHHAKGYFNLIDHFISPSNYLIIKMIEAGYPKEKFFHLPTFAYIPEKNSSEKKTDQVVYSGRLEYVKGVHVLLDAIHILKEKYRINLNLKLAGNGSEEYKKKLKEICVRKSLKNVEFVGNLKKKELFALLQNSSFSIAPSLWYDNQPNAVLESLSVGTPVIASDHGSFPEIIKDNETGVLFEPGNSEDLALKIKSLLDNKFLLEEMSGKSITFIKENHSPEKHYSSLMRIINNTIFVKN